MSRNPNDNHLPITQIFLCNGNVARFNCVVTPDNLPGGRRPRLDKRPNFAEFSACRMRVILKQKGKAYFPRSCQLSNLSYRCHGGFHRLHILMKESLCNSVSHVTQLCDRFLSTNWHMGNRMTANSLQPTLSGFHAAPRDDPLNILLQAFRLIERIGIQPRLCSQTVFCCRSAYGSPSHC